LIQAQYDAALQNPPWENTDDFEIDDRPKKKRRVTDRWYYEIVPRKGKTAVEQDHDEAEEPEGRRSPSPTSSAPGNAPIMQGDQNQSFDSVDQPRNQSGDQTTKEDSSIQSVCQNSRSPQAQMAYSSPLSSPISVSTLDFQLDSTKRDSSTPDRDNLASMSSSSSSRSQSSAPTAFTTDVSSTNSKREVDLLPDAVDESRSRSTSPFLEDPSQISVDPEDITSRLSKPLKTRSSSMSSQADHTADVESSLQSHPPDSSRPGSPEQTSSQTKSSRLPNLKGRDLFDSLIWSDPLTTSIFYMFISRLRQKIQNDITNTTPTHKFLRTLRDGGRLVRSYTQNIDSLEEREGLSTDLTLGAGNRSRFLTKTQREPRPHEVNNSSAHHGGVEVVLLHGSLVSLRCGICGKLSEWDEERESTTLSGSAPDCPSCAEYNARRTGRGRRGLAIGRLRPDIVLYGEEHPNATLVAPLITHDLSLSPDFLLIMGTSLKVHGLKVMVKEFAKAVHGRGGTVVFVNRTKPPESTWGEVIDYWVEWDCDKWVLDLKERREDLWLPQGSQECKSRRESEGKRRISSGDAKKQKSQTLRDDRMNGAYYTFKILDSLRSIEGPDGISKRHLYYPRSVRTSIVPNTTELSKPEPQKAALKASAKAPPKKAPNGKKRKSLPAAPPDRLSAASAKIWERLCALAPGLSSVPLKDGKMARADLDSALGSIKSAFDYQRSFEPPKTNLYPNLAGLGPLSKMNLITHPPSGADLPIHTPKSDPTPRPKPELLTEHKPVHAYSTRAARRFSCDTTIIVAEKHRSSQHRSSLPSFSQPFRPTIPSQLYFSSTEDTIVVSTPEKCLQVSSNASNLQRTHGSMTPEEQRIKSRGSIEAILSPTLDDGVRSTVSDCSQDVFYDALE
jgi:NAD-dependent SIR2 family protein deacetylase